MARLQYEISNILKEIDGSPNGIGFDVSLSRIYDEIKESRFEDDDSVSFGIWERELKKADWPKVEQLCVDALETQSKDLQILGWLIEALVMLEDFRGVAKGIEILKEFAGQFWNTCYPLTEKNESDQELKIRILTWLQNVLAKRSKLIPFIKNEDGESINLYNYEYAVDLKNATIRDPEAATNILNEAKKANIKTLEEIQNIINKESGYQTFLDQVKAIKNADRQLNEVLQPLIGENNTPFSGVIKDLEKIEKLLESKKGT